MNSLVIRTSSLWLFLTALLIAVALSFCATGHSYAAEGPSEISTSVLVVSNSGQAQPDSASDAENDVAVEQIEDDENALSAGITSTWSLVDLLCATSTLILSVGLLASISKRRLRGVIQLRHVVLGGLSTVPALVSVAAVCFTQDFAMPMSLVDEMSVFFAVLLAANLVIVLAANVKQRINDNNDLDLNKPDIANATA